MTNKHEKGAHIHLAIGSIKFKSQRNATNIFSEWLKLKIIPSEVIE